MLMEDDDHEYCNIIPDLIQHTIDPDLKKPEIMQLFFIPFFEMNIHLV